MIPPPGYFTEVRRLCTDRNVTLVLDEIQTGLGRTGEFLAERHEAIEADVTLVGKALSGGFYPISAVLSTTGSPRRAEARTAWVDLRRQSARLRRGADRVAGAGRGRHDRKRGPAGRLLSPRLERTSGRTSCARSAGRGLMMALELEPEAGGARRFCEALRRRGLLAKDTQRPHDPHRAAAGHHARRGRLGRRPVPCGAGTSAG